MPAVKVTNAGAHFFEHAKLCRSSIDLDSAMISAGMARTTSEAD